MCDTKGGTTAKFLHTGAQKNKSDARTIGKRDCADKPLDKLPTGQRKPLMMDGLSGPAGPARDMLMDVNKRP
jgi:hypothetical protein